MKSSRKWLTAIWIVFVVLTASSCAGKQKEETAARTETVSEAEEIPRFKIGVCIYHYDDRFMTQYREEIEKYLTEAYDADVTVVNGRGDQEEQNRQVSEFLEQGYDGLVINAIQVSYVEQLANQCRDASVPVVFINRAPDEKEIRRWKDETIAASYVGTDARQSGTYQGEIILETPNQGDFNGDGVVSYVMITGAKDNIDSEYRTEYSVKALEDTGIKTRCLTEHSGNWSQKEGYQLASNALFQYGREIEVIFCNNDAMANGARTAVLEAGRTVGGDICLVGVDALQDTVGYVKEGTITGTVFNDYVTQAHTAADAMMKMIRGEKADKEYIVDYVKIVGDLTNKTVGFCVPKTKVEEELRYRDELKHQLEHNYNVKVKVAEVEGDWESMVKEINAFSDQRVNAVIIDMAQVSVPEKVEKKCKDAGISALLLKVPEKEPDLEEENETEESGRQEEKKETSELDIPDSAGLAAEAVVNLAEQPYQSVIYMEKQNGR